MKKIHFFVQFFLLACVTLGYSKEIEYEIEFHGNNAFSNANLLEQMDLPEEFGVLELSRREFLLKLAQASLEDFYLTEGYFSARMYFDESITRDGVIIYPLRIYEGPKYKFRATQFSISGTDLVSSQANNLSVKSGDPFRFDRIAEDLQHLRTLYRKHGFLHLRIDHSEVVDTASKTVDITYGMISGTPVLMDSLRITSLRSHAGTEPIRGLTDSAWFASLWESKPGDTVDGTYLSDFRTKLLGTQIFSQLTVDDSLIPDGSGLSRISIRATERIPGESKVGTFFEQADGFGFKAETKHRNLFGTFHEGSVLGLVAQNRQEGVLGYANPLLFGTRVHFIPTAIRFDERIIVSHDQRIDSVNRYDAASRGDLSFGISTYVRSRTSAELRYVKKEMLTDTTQQSRLRLETGLVFDFTDNPIEPVKGIRLSPVVGVGRTLRPQSIAQAFLGESYPYVEFQSSLYFPIVGPLLAAASYDFGQYFSKASEDDASFYYQGGSRSVRGYNFRSIYPYKLIPTDSTPLAVAGLTPQYHRISEELRFNIPWAPLQNFQLVQFTDWARVLDADLSYTKGEEMALGMGLRYRWKVLVLRLDYTWKKQFKDWGPEPYQFSRVTFDLSQAI